MFASACGGLEPGEVLADSFLSGKISYVGGSTSWPDTSLQVRVIAFEEQPSTITDVSGAILTGKAIISEELPTRVDTSSYSFKVTGVPRTFKYVVVALQDGSDFLTDWLLVAVHSEVNDPEQPSTVVVNPGETMVIDFTVDFANLPPQPVQ